MFKFVKVKYKNILDIDDLEIEKGKITTFVGASGSGKTTILKLMNKLILPTSGNIYFEGRDLKSFDSVMLRRDVTMLTQNAPMFNGTIADNLNIGLSLQNRELKSKDQLLTILDKIKLDKDLTTPVDKLSGGEKQRIALGRALILEAKVYLLDEPSSALDSETEELIIKMIIESIKKSATTIVMVTHSKYIAKEYSDNIIEIANGKCLNCKESED